MKTLKNNIQMLSLMLVAMFGLVSCDIIDMEFYNNLDDDIAYTISGHWFGDMDMYDSYTGEKARGSEIEFYQNGPNFYSGTGVEVDYYYYSRPITNHFDWEVFDGVLYLYFDDPDLDCIIVDYRLSATSFTGFIESYDGYSTRFNLRNYERYWNDYGYSGYYTRAAEEPADSVSAVKGIRGSNMQHQ